LNGFPHTHFNQKKSVFALFVDFQTAYDTVWREKLLNKIKTIGRRANMYSWIREFITHRWIGTRWNNMLSKWKETKAGLPQGQYQAQHYSICTLMIFQKKLNKIKKLKLECSLMM
jgi:hypothetical protein